MVDKLKEIEIKNAVKPYLLQGRPGDYEHTLRAVAYGKRLLEVEEGEEDIVIPTLYVHDVGWSQVDFSDFMQTSSITQKKYAKSVELHMRHGSELSRNILRDLNYKEEIVRTIGLIVANHDRPDYILEMGHPSALLVFEADYLDKLGPESLHRFREMFGDDFMENYPKESLKEMMRAGFRRFFRTRTALSIALELIRKSGLFTEDEIRHEF